MNMRWIFLLNFLGLMLSISSISYASGFAKDSDILGFKLTMTIPEVKQMVVGQCKSCASAIIPIDVTTNDYSEKGDAGLIYELASTGSKGIIQEQMSFLFNPNKGANDIFAISRFVLFESPMLPAAKQNFVTAQQMKEYQQRQIKVNSNLVLKQTMLNALIDKYGPPLQKLPSGSGFEEHYLWALNKATLTPKCIARGGYDAYFYDGSIKNSGGNGDVDSEASQAANGFVSTTNDISSDIVTNDYSKCGTVLRVDLTLTDIDLLDAGQNPKYLNKMFVELVDLSKGTNELKLFAGQFFSKADREEDKRLSKDSKNKVKL